MTDIDNKKLWADFRGDLVRRLFAVAISIGVGAALITTDWVKDGRLPTANEAEQIAIVAVALLATVLSWDGYLVSIHNKPLFDWPRFAIDVLLVFTYMFLIATSKHKTFWLPIMCWMFAWYTVWDALSINQFPSTYDKTSEAGQTHRLLLIPKVYLGGALNRAGIDRGPIITVCWASFFFALTWMTLHFKPFNVFIACIIATIGLFGYRRDKSHIVNGTRGFRMLSRVLLIVLVLSAAYGFGFYTRN